MARAWLRFPTPGCPELVVIPEEGKPSLVIALTMNELSQIVADGAWALNRDKKLSK